MINAPALVGLFMAVPMFFVVNKLYDKFGIRFCVINWFIIYIVNECSYYCYQFCLVKTSNKFNRQFYFNSDTKYSYYFSKSYSCYYDMQIHIKLVWRYLGRYNVLISLESIYYWNIEFCNKHRLNIKFWVTPCFYL